VVFGLVDESITDELDGSFVDVVDALQDRLGEFNLVRMTTDGRIDAYRDVTSNYELYTTTSSDGEPIVTDTFREATARLDVSDRTVPQSALADHYMFRTTLGTNTYIDEIDRLGHGQWLQWDVKTGRKIPVQFRRLSASSEATSKADVLSELDATLKVIYDGITERTETPIVTMLSGGIDSTLLQTYSPTRKSMSANVTVPEFQSEVGYAKRASQLTGSSHTLIEVDESSFLQDLEETTEVLGKPLHHLQKVFWNAAFRAGDWQTYVTGIFGDSWFGAETAKAAALVSQHPLLFDPRLTNVGKRILPAPYSSYASTVSDVTEKLRRPVTHPYGLANSFAFYGNSTLATTVTSEETTRRRLTDRFRYVNRVVDLPITGESSALGAHLELGHVINYYMSNSGPLGRQLAQSRDVTLFSPFTDRRIGTLALSIPSPTRYLDGLTPKHHLKSLLKSRVPRYDTSKPKEAGGLPTTRWMSDGPLSEGFETYELPDHLPARIRSELVDSPRMDSWNALCYAIWEDRVLTNPDIRIGSDTREIVV
jgi:hypothetical protein